MKRSKYNARKVWLCERGHIGDYPPPENLFCDCGMPIGQGFDSKKEAKRWLELRRLERAGKIANLQRQVKIDLEIDGIPIKIRSKGYPNGRQVTWTSDFEYQEGDDAYIIEDVKGMDTSVSRLKRAIVEAMLGIEIKVT